MSLPGLLAAATFEQGRLSTTIPDGWLQGRTAYGGVSAAIALAAVKLAYPDLPPLRSAQIAFIGPLSGSITAQPHLLRRGKNSAFIGCDVTSEDGIGLRALFLFMASRVSEISYQELGAPVHDAPEIAPIDMSRFGPGFMNNFESAGAGHKPAVGYTGWSRLLERQGLDPAVEFIAIADRLPPAAMALVPKWGPVSTTTWQLNLVTDAPTSPDGWWLLEAQAQHARDGGSSQTMTIWNREGVPMATATQSVALFL